MKADDVFIILIKPIIDMKQIHANINKQTGGQNDTSYDTLYM